MKKTNNRMIGVLFVVFGASFWGVGGTASDYLFTQEGIHVNWFVSARLVISGFLLLGAQALFGKDESIFTIWKDKRTRFPIIIFGLFGMLLVQYSYMVAIDVGNAAIATLLQYLAPVYILIWLIARKEERLQISDVFAVLLTLVGTLLLLTNGSFQGLSVPGVAVFWGVISGIALAFYTLYGKRLLDLYSSVTIVGWAMLVAGFFMNFVHPIWQVDVSDWSWSTIIGLAFTIIFGTTLAFWMFIKSLEYLEAKETTLLGAMEPLTAVISSVVWLNLPFGAWQVVGMILILVMVVYLSFVKKEL